MVDLKELRPEALEAFVLEMGLERYRAAQLLHWIYEKEAISIEEITELSKPLRASLSGKAFISTLKLLERRVSADGTQKLLFGLGDGLAVESVIIPLEDRLTICISSQVGCAMGCRFCLTGRGGLKRSLKAHEIVDQVIASSAHAPSPFKNVVLMGMGEPLQNLDEVVDALWRMTRLMKISPRRITVSTCGVADRMEEFANRAPKVNLAVSLNATTDETRSEIMPINLRFPIRRLLEACRRYPLASRRRITFEYVMVDGLNDTRGDALRLVRLLRGIPSKVNLIPLNEFECCRFKRPPEERITEFQELLASGGLTSTIRKSRGGDILAACGQLSASTVKRASR